jgi:uncharacterized membrane protein YjjP (DUF1212 family)
MTCFTNHLLMLDFIHARAKRYSRWSSFISAISAIVILVYLNNPFVSAWYAILAVTVIFAVLLLIQLAAVYQWVVLWEEVRQRGS